MERVNTILLDYIARTEKRFDDIADVLETMDIVSALALVHGIITEHKAHGKKILERIG